VKEKPTAAKKEGLMSKMKPTQSKIQRAHHMSIEGRGLK